MLKSARNCLSLALIVFASSCLAAGAPVPMTNSGFEDGLDGWALLKPKGFGHGELVVITEGVRSGAKAARLRNVAEGDQVMTGLFSSFVPLPDDCRTFALTLWLKLDKPADMIELRIAAADKDGKSLSPWNEKGWRFFRPSVDAHAGVWKAARAEFAALEEWGGFYLTAWVRGAGAEMLIDDLSLEAVDPQDWMIDSTGQRLPGPDPEVALWWEGPLRKVFADEQPPVAQEDHISMRACGGEYECAQLCLRPDRALTQAQISFSDLTGPAVLPASSLRANFVGSIDIKLAKTGRSKLGPTPDPLLTETRLDLPGGETRPIWLTLQVPRGAPAGDYSSTLTLRAEGFEASVPIRVHVYGFDLPERPTLRTIARVWQSHPGYMNLFEDNLQAHRCSGRGQMGGISAKREGDGIVVDTSGLASAAANFRAHGFEVFNIPRVFMGDASGLYAKDGKWLGFDVFTPEFDAAFEDYCRRVGDAVRAEGLMEYAIWQIWDEPQHAEMMKKCIHLARIVKKAAPDARIYLTTGVHDELIDLVDIWNLPWPGTYSQADAKKARAHGADLWAYDNSIYAMDVCDSSLRMRYFPWRLRRYDIQGVEWWAVSQWRTDPWLEPNQYERQNGGGFFLYPTPDRKGAPIDSIRWELYREGVEDYDILTLLAQEQDRACRGLGLSDQRLSGDAQMKELVGRVALGPGEVATDPRLAEDLKRQASERIELLQGEPAAIIGLVTEDGGKRLLVVAPDAQITIDGEQSQGNAERMVGHDQRAQVTVTRGDTTRSIWVW